MECRAGAIDIYALLKDTGVPADGIVFHDPYSNFVGYWKPWRTADVFISREKQGLVAFAHKQDWPVDDPRCRFVSNGVYEVVANDGKLKIIHSRMDKDKTGDVPLHNRNTLFDYDAITGKLVIDNLSVNFINYTLTDYLSNYGRVYNKIVSNLVRLHLSYEDAKVAYDLVREHLVNFAVKVETDIYLVSDFVSAIVARTGFEPKRLWGSFVYHKFISKKSEFSNPEIRKLGSDFKAIIRFK